MWGVDRRCTALAELGYFEVKALAQPHIENSSGVSQANSRVRLQWGVDLGTYEELRLVQPLSGNPLSESGPV